MVSCGACGCNLPERTAYNYEIPHNCTCHEGEKDMKITGSMLKELLDMETFKALDNYNQILIKDLKENNKL